MFSMIWKINADNTEYPVDFQGRISWADFFSKHLAFLHVQSRCETMKRQQTLKKVLERTGPGSVQLDGCCFAWRCSIRKMMPVDWCSLKTVENTDTAELKTLNPWLKTCSLQPWRCSASEFREADVTTPINIFARGGAGFVSLKKISWCYYHNQHICQRGCRIFILY